MVYRFAEFEVDGADFHFSASGKSIPLEPKVLRLLLYLLENRNRLVRKQELLDALWPEASVTENALTRVVGLLRKALGDDSQNPRFLQTVPTAGYRFVAEVKVEAISESASPAHAVPVRSEALVPPQSGSKRRLDTRAILAVAVVAVAAVAWMAIRRPFHAESAASPALLVLPLKNIGQARDSYLADSLTEELTTSLAQYRNLSVVSSTTARRLGNTTPSIAEITKQVNVSAVLEGSVLRQPGHAHIDLRLIDAAKDRQEWSRTLDVTDAELSGLTNRVAPDVISAMHVPLSSEDRASPQPVTSNAAAYDAYLQGKYFFLQGTSRTPETEWPKAAAALETAIRLDPEFAEPYALLAEVHQMDAHRGLGDAKVHVERASFLANKALALNPRLALAHNVLGQLHMEKAGDFSWAAAATEFRNAIRSDPSDAQAHGLLGALYMRTGLLDKATEENDIAYKLDPSFHYYQSVKIQLLEYQQRYQEANDLCLQTEGRSGCVNTLWESGRHDEAWSAMQEVLNDPVQRSQHPSYGLASVEAVLLAHRGEKRAAEKVIEQALKTPNQTGNTFYTYAEYNLGAAYAVLGEDAKAIPLLESAAHDGLPCYPLYANDPELANIRSNRKFMEFLERLHRQNEQFRATL